jgi:molybdenum-dependent DNA-binding transcriptional regulator ModE
VNEAIDLTRKNVDRANTGFLGLLHTDEERAELTTKLNALLAERARLETVISHARHRADQDRRAIAGSAARFQGRSEVRPRSGRNAKAGSISW